MIYDLHDLSEAPQEFTPIMFADDNTSVISNSDFDTLMEQANTGLSSYFNLVWGSCHPVYLCTELNIIKASYWNTYRYFRAPSFDPNQPMMNTSY